MLSNIAYSSKEYAFSKKNVSFPENNTFFKQINVVTSLDESEA